MPHRALALACFFLSGATGLMYEVLWTRIFGGTIGNTHFSITLVVSVFMGGLGLGSYIGGRFADRSPNPLRLYGVLTLLVGVSCLLVPAAVVAARPLFAWLYGFNDGVPEAPVLLVAKILVSAAILLVPTSFMGATLPALSRYFTRRLSDVGKTIGGLYALNTLGAVAGASFTGFAGIRLLGLWGVTALAVVIDLAIGVAVILAARRVSMPGGERAGAQSAALPSPRSTGGTAPVGVRISLLAFGVAGFADMLLQIAWTRAIVLSIGNSTYAFSLIVTLFILGIAIGGGIMSFFADRIANLVAALGVLMLITAGLVAATIPFLGHFPILAARWFDWIEEPSHGKFLAVQLLLVSAAILPSTILMGTVFPIVGKIRTRAVEEVGSAVGSAYFSNTMGSILGTLAAGFLFIPLLGRVHYTLYLGAAITLAMGAALLLAGMRSGVPARAAVVLGAAALVVVPSFILRPHGVLGSGRHFWHEGLMSRGAYAYYQGTYRTPDGKVMPVKDLIERLTAENRVLFYEEGIHAPVAVVQSLTGQIAMRISGKVEASLAPEGGFNTDLPHQVLAGHLPMILHPDPKDVLTLGLGGGVTLGTLTLYPVDSIDSLEISSLVIKAARDYFSAANRGALASSRVRNVIGDGRNHLEYTSRRYDVITSVPSNPWIAGIGSLFTVEFFETCRDRLKPGGIMCNWIHKVNLRAEDFRTVVRTFAEVFAPHAQLWDLGYDCLLIGGSSPVRVDPARVRKLLEDPEIARDLAGMGIAGPEALLRHYLLDAGAMAAYAGTEGPLNTDSFPILEFLAPYGLHGHYFDAFRSLAFARASPVAADLIAPPEPAVAERGRERQELFGAWLRLEARTERLIALQKGSVGSAGGAGPTGKEEQLELFRGSIEDLERLARGLGKGEDPWLAAKANHRAVGFFGVDAGPTVGATLASGLIQLAEQSAPDAKLRYLEEASPFAGEGPQPALKAALLWIQLGNPGRGKAILQAALVRTPGDARLLQILGVTLAEEKMIDAAIDAFAQALASTKDAALRSEIHFNTSLAHDLAGRRDDALRECELALRENPANELAKKRLEVLRKAAPPGAGGG